MTAKLVTYIPRPMPTLGGDQLYLQQEMASISNAIAASNAAIKDDENAIAANAAAIAARTVAPDTSWHSFAYQNGWVDYPAPHSPSGYRKLSSGLVVLRGLCMSGTATGIATLPAGYRPGIQRLFCVYTNPNVPCRVDISPTGVITHTGGSSGWLSFDGITFLAEL